MNQQDFFIKWNHEFNDCDNNKDAQCVDIVKQYFKDVLGIAPIHGNAIDYTKDIPGFIRIPYKVGEQAKPGDLIIWDYKPVGHIGICNWSRVDDIGVFEQNNPIGNSCQFATHDYSHVVCFQRPTMLPPEAPRPSIPAASQEKLTIKMVYLSDTDDLKDAVAYCNDKFREFTNGALGVEYVFNQIPAVEAQMNLDLDQNKASDIVDSHEYTSPFDLVVLGYNGWSTSPGYYTVTTFKRGIWMITGHKQFEGQTLLFELHHYLTKVYDQHRGTNPFIDDYDNFKFEDEASLLAKTKEQIQLLIPYLSVLKFL